MSYQTCLNNVTNYAEIDYYYRQLSNNEGNMSQLCDIDYKPIQPIYISHRIDDDNSGQGSPQVYVSVNGLLKANTRDIINHNNHIITLYNVIENYRKEKDFLMQCISNLNTKVQELEQAILYQPGGSIAQQVEEDFVNCIENRE